MKHSKSKENKTKEVFEKVVNSVQTIIDNGEYEKFLKFQNSFRGYSFNNLVHSSLMLHMLQVNPNG